MRCPNCGYEGESRFCPECGTPMEEYLPAAEPVGEQPAEAETAYVWSGERGQVPPQPADAAQADAGPAYTRPTPGKRSIKKIIIIVVVAVAAVLIAAIIALAVVMRGLTDHPELFDESGSSSTTTSEEVDSDDLFSDDEEAVSGDDEDIASVETQGKELPGGTYVVGEDISAGKYNFTYTTEMSEDDYWSNDYFYITRAGSEGSEETLGGTKFDERFGSIDYESAKAGKTFYANLKSGDKLLVDSEFGNWTY